MNWLKGIAAIALIAFLGYSVDHHGYARAKAEYELKIAKSELQAETALGKAKSEDANRYAAAQRSILNLTERLIAADQTVDAQKAQLQKRAKDVSTTYRPAPTAALAPVPGWIVTNGWVCDYNRAAGYATGNGVQEAGATIAGDADTTCEADPFVPSGVTAEQILLHHEEFGAYTVKLEERLQRWADYADQQQGTAP